MQTLIIYFVVFISTVIITNYIKKKEDKWLKLKALIISLPCLIVMSLRYGIGTDYFNYFNIYIYPDALGIGKYEFLFTQILNLSRFLSDNFQFFIFITSFITVYLFTYCVLVNIEQSYWDLAVFIVLCLYFGIWCAAIGQVIAIGIAFFAIKEIENKNFGKFLLFTILAGLFHSSALIVLPCYFIISSKKSVTVSWQIQLIRMICIVISCVIFTQLFYRYGDIVGIKYASYINNFREGGRTAKFLMFSSLFYLPEVYLMFSTIHKYPNARLYYYLLVLEATTFIMSISVAYAFRIGQYFSIAHVVLAPLTISSCSNGKRRFLLLLYYVFAFGFYFYYTTFALNYNGIVPYRIYLFK